MALLSDFNTWAQFIGRFHPLLVHLPIGFMILALLLEVGRFLGKIDYSRSITRFIWLCSAWGATFSCAVGYLLSISGGYDQEMLDQHQWSGIALAVIAWVVYSSSSIGWIQRLPKLSVFYLPGVIIAFILLGITGHLGGNLTHGEGYLTEQMPEPFRGWLGIESAEKMAESGIKPIQNVEQALVYEDIVQPILTARCVQCHGSSKQKGKLRLDGYDQIVKGGENGDVIVIGKGDESSLVSLCLLPLEDDMHMPPKGKTQLTTSQISLIRWWIDAGAPRQKKVADLQPTDNILPDLQTLTAGGDNVGGNGAGPKSSLLEGITVKEGDVNSIDALRKLNLIVSPVARTQNLLEVSAVNASDVTDVQLSPITGLAEQVVWLKLVNTSITDTFSETVSKFIHLNKLNVEGTKIGDHFITKLVVLDKLEYLNLIGTAVTDASIANIAAIKNLRSVYVWKSGITEEGIARLKELRPDLQVIGGISEEQVKAFLEEGQKNASPAK